MISIKQIPKIFIESVPSYYIQASSVDRRLLKDVPLRDKKVLNIGCGRNIIDDVFFAMNGAEVVSVDYTKEKVKIAKEKVKIAKEKHLIDNIKIKVEYGDGRNLKFEDSSFDIVTSFSAIEHMPSEKDRLKVVKEMVRVAKPGGIVILTGPNLLNFPTTLLSHRVFKKRKEFEHRYTPKELKNMLTSNNLKIEKFDAESVYIIDKRFIERKLPFIKFLPLWSLKPLSLGLWLFNAIPLFKKLGMRIGYRSKKLK